MRFVPRVDGDTGARGGLFLMFHTGISLGSESMRWDCQVVWQSPQGGSAVTDEIPHSWCGFPSLGGTESWEKKARSRPCT